MLTEYDGLGVHIDGLGNQSYFFQYTSAKVCAAGAAKLRKLPLGKGIGTIANTALSQSVSVYNEQSIAICVTGENARYVCKYCHAKIALKAKARNDFPTLTFCSDDCLRQAGPYLDFCGFAGNEINAEQWGDSLTLVQVAVHYVYSISIANTADALARALQILELESHPESVSAVDTLHAAAQWLYAYFQVNLPSSTLTALSTRSFDLREKTTGISLLYRLLRIIKYNAQAVPVHGVPKVQLLCLLPSVARLNHSCAPNCTLLYDVYRSTVPNTDTESQTDSVYSLRITVLPLKDIALGEELTMSYIQPLCGSTDFRRTLLQQGFLFECQCERCSASTVAPILNEHSAALDTKLQITMQSAQSSQKGVSYVSLVELLSLSESLLHQLPVKEVAIQAENSSLKSAPSVSEVHDAASFVLQQSLLTLKMASTGSGAAMDAVQQGKVLELIVRASLTLSQCWALAGCAHLLQRIEVAVSGSAYAVQLLKVERVVKMKFACIQLFKQELESVIHVLESVYHCDNPGMLIENSKDRQVKSINDPAIRVQRETSTLPYLCKLYRKAEENFGQLK